MEPPSRRLLPPRAVSGRSGLLRAARTIRLRMKPPLSGAGEGGRRWAGVASHTGSPREGTVGAGCGLPSAGQGSLGGRRRPEVALREARRGGTRARSPPGSPPGPQPRSPAQRRARQRGRGRNSAGDLQPPDVPEVRGTRPRSPAHTRRPPSLPRPNALGLETGPPHPGGGCRPRSFSSLCPSLVPSPHLLAGVPVSQEAFLSFSHTE